MLTLGINAAFHDSSAALVRDGVLLAAAEEERFSRIKHGKRPIPFSAYELPFAAIDYCLQVARVTLGQVDHVAYSYDPGLQSGVRRQKGIVLPIERYRETSASGFESEWDPLFVAHILNAPRHLAAGAPHHLSARLAGLDPHGPKNFHFVPHHMAHAASAFHCSPFEESAVLTLDGRGEAATTTYWLGSENKLSPLGEVAMPHSLGLLYEEVTTHLGFLHSSDEYKVMALAAYGKPTFVPYFESLISLGDHGTYVIR